MAATQLLLVSGCSGHADRSRASVDAGGSCSYLSDCMSLSAYRHLLRVHWAVDWRTHGLDTRQSAVAAKTWAASTCHAMAPTELLLVSGCSAVMLTGVDLASMQLAPVAT